MIESLTFICSICGEASTRICIYCTKDSCENHLCTRCSRCSDCCECDLHSWRGRTVAQRVAPPSAPPNGAAAAPPDSAGSALVESRSEDQSDEVPGNQNSKRDVDLAE